MQIIFFFIFFSCNLPAGTLSVSKIKLFAKILCKEGAGAGYGSVPLTIGSGSGRPKNSRIPNTGRDSRHYKIEVCSYRTEHSAPPLLHINRFTIPPPPTSASALPLPTKADHLQLRYDNVGNFLHFFRMDLYGFKYGNFYADVTNATEPHFIKQGACQIADPDLDPAFFVTNN
jgi:hypothetical protein